MSSTVTTAAIPTTQRAAVIESFKAPYTLRTDHPVKQPSELAPGECLVKLDYSGVCHSDLHVRNDDWSSASRVSLPRVGGHEGIGRVVAIGEHSGDHVKIGDRVGLKWVRGVCGRCEMCWKGHDASCSTQTAHGFTADGTFQEYVVSLVNYVTPIPEGLDGAAAAPILCGGLAVYKALKQTNLTVGQWVAIPGAGGGLGHLAVQYAIAMGLRVLAIDTGETKKKLCLGLGAEKWVDFRESTDLISDVKAATDGLGPDAAVIAAGDARPYNQAPLYLRHNGVMVCVGMPGGSALLNVPLVLVVAKSLKIIGSSVGNQQDITEALRIAALGKVKCQHEVKEFEELNSVLVDMEEGKVTGRVVIRF